MLTVLFGVVLLKQHSFSRATFRATFKAYHSISIAIHEGFGPHIPPLLDESYGELNKCYFSKCQHLACTGFQILFAVEQL
jgi:hypothetical protein